jgi:hypothetical protein
MNSYFDYINPISIHIIFDKNLKKDNKHIILDPRSPNKRSPNLQRQPQPKLSLASAGEWEKEYPHYLINNIDFIPQATLNSIIKKSSVPILSYT